MFGHIYWISPQPWHVFAGLVADVGYPFPLVDNRLVVRVDIPSGKVRFIEATKLILLTRRPTLRLLLVGFRHDGLAGAKNEHKDPVGVNIIYF